MSTPREVRQARRDKRMPESLEKWAPLLAPLEPANDADPQGDEAWRDAIAEANGRSDEVNRRD